METILNNFNKFAAINVGRAQGVAKMDEDNNTTTVLQPADVEDWSKQTTVDFPRQKDFDVYADYFEEMGYNGDVVKDLDPSDVAVMPQADKLKQKAFLRLIARLNS